MLKSEIEAMKLEARKRRCEKDPLYFSRYFFKKRQGIKFLINFHHYLISEALERVRTGITKNLVINVAPGSSKTEIAVINFIARCLALNPNCRFLHISSSDDLVLLNSQTARDIVQSDEYQDMWPMHIADDAKSKKRWNVMNGGRKAGGVYAVALGGQITGFRAGHMTAGFQGAVIVDDPLKADDAYSPAAIKTANRRLLSTVKSRRATAETPIILIMQRLGENDPTGFIKGGNMPGKWEFLNIPALIDDEYVKKLPDYIREHVVSGVRDEKGRFSYWEYKEPLAELLQLEAGNGNDADGKRVSRHTFNAQYQQRPVALGGNIIHGHSFVRVSILPKIIYRKMYADTAQKTKERNDYSVLEVWGQGEDKKIYLLDLMRGKWEAPQLKQNVIEFWNKHRAISGIGALRRLDVEDKASGTGLIQDIRQAGKIPVIGIERNKDKLTRVMDVVSYIEAGCVCVLEDAPYLSDFIAECEAFTADDTHAHDDQIDPMCDAITDMLGARPRGIFGNGVLAQKTSVIQPPAAATPALGGPSAQGLLVDPHRAGIES